MSKTDNNATKAIQQRREELDSDGFKKNPKTFKKGDNGYQTPKESFREKLSSKEGRKSTEELGHQAQKLKNFCEETSHNEGRLLRKTLDKDLHTNEEDEEYLDHKTISDNIHNCGISKRRKLRSTSRAEKKVTKERGLSHLDKQKGKSINTKIGEVKEEYPGEFLNFQKSEKLTKKLKNPNGAKTKKPDHPMVTKANDSSRQLDLDKERKKATRKKNAEINRYWAQVYWERGWEIQDECKDLIKRYQSQNGMHEGHPKHRMMEMQEEMTNVRDTFGYHRFKDFPNLIGKLKELIEQAEEIEQARREERMRRDETTPEILQDFPDEESQSGEMSQIPNQSTFSDNRADKQDRI